MRYLVTAALPYANGPVHIGHLAGCYLPADIFVRYLRLKGADVKFICGSDEHGVPITIKAKKEGITPQQVVDKYHTLMGNAFKEFGMSFDIYSRTSNPVHHQTAADFFKTLYDKNVFVEEITEQYFDESANQFLADRYITGTCPKCGNENAYGDQCEKCGTSLSPTELINPKSSLSGQTPVLKKTLNWFLPLDKMQPQIEAFVNQHPNWKTHVQGQVKSWLQQGLQPRAMTRDLDWGVKVPLQDAEGKVLYVWFDAPIGYISATKELTAHWEDYWKKSDTKLVHFIGKDNIVFHCIIFPAMLMAEGSYILPDNVPANEFLNLEGDKISTSRNWAVWLHEYLQDFPNKQDELRYVLTSIAPETADSEFTWKDFQARVNNELVAIIGNYVNRVMVLMHKYYQGIIPGDAGKTVELTDAGLQNAIDQTRQKLQENVEAYKFRSALFEVVELARAGNKYLTEQEPWKRYATEPALTAETLCNSLVHIAQLAVCMQPFLPNTAAKIFNMLNLNQTSFGLAETIALSRGHQLNESKLLFEKIEDDAIEKQRAKLQASKDANQKANLAITPFKGETTYDDFTKMDIRVGTIVAAERVPKTDKLLKLLIDTGIDTRTIVSGIAQYYEPEVIIGKQVSVLVNLAPRKLKGIESQGMILMAENPDGSLAFVSPEKGMENGGVIR